MSTPTRLPRNPEDSQGLFTPRGQATPGASRTYNTPRPKRPSPSTCAASSSTPPRIATLPANVYIIMWARSPSESGERTTGRPLFAMPTFAKAKYWLDYECQMIKNSTPADGRETVVEADAITQVAELRHGVMVPRAARAPETHLVYVNYYWVEMIKVQPDDGAEKIGSWRK
ncbi:hypothetical protein K504DRAFT_533757 [Pleomassaria siparia CBS 279.74]|uniref:Uncharacterized protein n=1 Tax=Pleomassaria siparia CBS 279.74 TaxID=1314801 RepID=A0A6G1K907_9PLEO|nr:hypothetical protein K504DRAFT_533757 [Pleomassaria siparia CBS 279.74]